MVISIEAKTCFKDLRNQRFGNLLVVELLVPTGSIKDLWLCKCCCGKYVLKTTKLLTPSNGTRSCGCLKYNSGRKRTEKFYLRQHPMYSRWKAMLARCRYPSNDSYPNYGGRGIQVCEEWLDLKNFLSWCDAQPSVPKNYQIDRIDPNKGYSPENCRLVSQSQNLRNRRDTRFVDYNNERLDTKSFWEKYGIVSYRCFRDRVFRGWDPIKAGLEPLRLNQYK